MKSLAASIMICASEHKVKYMSFITSKHAGVAGLHDGLHTPPGHVQSTTRCFIYLLIHMASGMTVKLYGQRWRVRLPHGIISDTHVLKCRLSWPDLLIHDPQSVKLPQLSLACIILS